MRKELSAGYGFLLFQVIAIGLYLNSSGQLTPVLMPDSSSYLEFPLTSVSEAVSNARTPGYPIFLNIIQLVYGDLSPVPLVQYLCFCVSVLLFYLGLRNFCRSNSMCFLCASSLLYANILHRHLHFVATDCLAGACGIMAISFLMMQTGQQGQRGKLIYLLAIGMATVLCWLIRPAYLFLVLLVPLLGGILELFNPDGNPRRVKWYVAPAQLSLTTMIPLLAYCTFRLVLIGSFGIVSFGGYNIIGLSGQFLDRNTVEKLPDDLQPLAKLALKRRDELESNTSSMEGLSRTNYMKIERNYDRTIWSVFAPAARKLYSGNPEINSQLGKLGWAIVRLQPMDYVIWLIKAVRQSFFKLVSDFVMNPVYFLLVITVVLVECAKILLGRAGLCIWKSQSPSVLNIHVLFIISIFYFFSSMLVVILVCPPFGRMTDAMWVFFPAVLVGILVNQMTYLAEGCKNGSDFRSSGKGCA